MIPQQGLRDSPKVTVLINSQAVNTHRFWTDACEIPENWFFKDNKLLTNSPENKVKLGPNASIPHLAPDPEAASSQGWGCWGGWGDSLAEWQIAGLACESHLSIASIGKGEAISLWSRKRQAKEYPDLLRLTQIPPETVLSAATSPSCHPRLFPTQHPSPQQDGHHHHLCLLSFGCPLSEV